MKSNCIILLVCLVMASCNIQRYYIIEGNIIKDSKTIRYDQALPDVPKLSVIKDASEYNKEDKYTFPIYGNETAVAPPPLYGQGKNRLAIWCTRDCTLIAHLTQMSWDMHYFQQSSKCYIEDVKTKKKYYIQSDYCGIPLDKSYNIKGVSGEWICSFYVFPPLPKTCTIINIVDGHVTDVVKNGLGWDPIGMGVSNMPVEKLQQNQTYIRFQKTRIIE